MPRQTPANPQDLRKVSQPGPMGGDTYVQPAPLQRTEEGALTRLARSLASFEPALEKYVATEKKRIDDKDKNEAVALMEKTGKKYSEAVKAGVIPPGASPAFHRYYRLQELKNSGQRYENELRTAWAAAPPEQRADPNGLQAFELAFRQDWAVRNLDGHLNGEIGEAFAPSRKVAADNLQREDTARRIREIEELGKQAMVTGIAGRIQEIKDGRFPDAETAAAALSQLGADYVRSNPLGGPDANKALVDAIVAQAEESDDPAFLGILDKVTTGTGILGRTTYAKQKREDAEARINNEHFRREDREWTRRERKRQEAERRGLASFVSAWRASGGNLNPIEWFKESEFKDSPEVLKQAMTVEGALNTVTTAGHVLDTDWIAEFNRRRREDPNSVSYNEITDALADGRISSSVAFVMHDDWVRDENARNKRSDLYNNDMIALGRANLGKEVMGDPMAKYNPQVAAQASDAQMEYTMRVHALIEDAVEEEEQTGKKMRQTEFMDKAHKIYMEIISKYRAQAVANSGIVVPGEPNAGTAAK